MKRILPHIFITLTFATAFIVPASAFAIVVPPATTPTATTPTAAPTTPASTASTDDDGSCGIVCELNPLTYVPKIADATLELYFLPFAGFMLALSGYMLDFMINYSLGFASQVSTAGSSIVLGWTIIRDIFNMMFIFILIYVSISTMLGEGGFQAKNILKNVIIAALLINFSFFFTEVIIDAGNVVGGWLYQGIQTTLVSADATNPLSGNTSLSAGLSGALGVYDIYNSNSSQWSLVSGSLNSSTQRLISASIRLAVIIFATYIFVYVAVLFLARTISLMFSLVMAPVGFAGGLLPATKKAAEEWRDELQKNVLIMPVFLLFLYIILAFVNSPLFNAPNLGATTNVNAFNPSQYFKYFLLAGMLLYALDKTKQYSGKIGDALGKIADQLAQVVAGASVMLATGGTAAILRSSVGSMGANMAQKAQNTLIDENASTGAKRFARIQRFAATKVAGASFDARQTGALKNAGFTGQGFGLDLGKPSKESGRAGGYLGEQKARAENEKKYAEAYKPQPEDIERMNSMRDAQGNTAASRIVERKKASSSEYSKAVGDAEEQQKEYERMDAEVTRMIKAGEDDKAVKAFDRKTQEQKKTAESAKKNIEDVVKKLKDNIKPKELFDEERGILNDLTKSNNPLAASYKQAFTKARGRELYAETTKKVDTFLRDEEVASAPFNIATTAAIRMTTNNLARAGSAIAKTAKGDFAGAAKQIGNIAASPVTEIVAATKELQARHAKALEKMSKKQWDEIKPQKADKEAFKELAKSMGLELEEEGAKKEVPEDKEEK